MASIWLCHTLYRTQNVGGRRNYLSSTRTRCQISIKLEVSYASLTCFLIRKCPKDSKEILINLLMYTIKICRIKNQNLLRSSGAFQSEIQTNQNPGQITSKIYEYKLVPTELPGKFPLISMLQEWSLILYFNV